MFDKTEYYCYQCGFQFRAADKIQDLGVNGVGIAVIIHEDCAHLYELDRIEGIKKFLSEQCASRRIKVRKEKL